MQLKADCVAKKYAQALLNLYYDVLDQRCFDSLVTLDEFFTKNKQILAYLSIPTISGDVKETVLLRLFEKLTICKAIRRLVPPLVRHRRIGLFGKIVYHLIQQFRIRKNVLVFKIMTSHKLEKKEQDKVILFLDKVTGASICAKFVVDKRLISGIRIQGDNLMYEQSIAKKLKSVENSVLQRVKLW